MNTLSKTLRSAIIAWFVAMAWQHVAAATPVQTGFEQASPGVIREMITSVGTWRAAAGHAEVTAKYQFTGKQCLHIVGGNERQVEFTPASAIKTPGKLLFQAERWTKRKPFVFRVEERVNGKWVEIFNGDRAVVVGRAFKSRVAIPLRRNPERLRFTCTSPENSGILIDDVALVPASPQKISSVTMEGIQVPVLHGQEINPLLLVRVEVSGMLKPIQFTGAEVQLTGSITDADLDNVQWHSSGNSPNISAAKPVEVIGVGVHGRNGRYTFKGEHALIEGTNHFWVSVKLSKRANIDRTIRAACSFLKFSDGKIHKPQAANSAVHRLGVAVRQGGQGGVHTSRIPGLATTPKGTLIGVYDLRHLSGGDLPGDIDVGMSRSTDGGQTWEPTRAIMDMGRDAKWRYDGIGDPAVLVDRNTGTIWVAATWSHGNRSWVGSGPGMKPEETGQFMLVRSDDDGVTWSKPINITAQVKRPEWCFILQGPGKGITMADGTIVFAAQYQDPPNKRRLPHSTIIYSKDHGKTWLVGTGAYDDTTEAQVAEIEPGVLMLNCRYNRQSARVVMVTRDMGKTWQPHPTNRKALIEPRACMASLISIDGERKGKPGARLLFSNPNSLRGRNHITIKSSNDRGLTWPAESQLLLDQWGSAGYSCMSMIDDKTVGILYEGSRAHMTFQRVKLKDIASAPPKKSAAKKPNVLLIVSEDNGPELGCYGDPYARTPHLDRLAREGVRFATAWVPYSVCSPSRACFLTGRYPHRNGQLGLATHKFAMFKKWPNLFSLLKTAGYRTALLGKIHVNPTSAFPLDRHWNPSGSISFAKRDVRRIAAEAGKFMREADAPFVMSVNYPDAHYPLHRQLNGLPTFPQTADEVKPLPWIGVNNARLRKHTADYYNCLARLDTGVGLLLEELANSGKAENTLVIYIGDHGAQFSRGKTSVYEAGLHVPFIVRWPGHTKAGHVANELISSLDILPTVLQAANVKPPAGLDGRALQPLLEGRFIKWREHLFAHKMGAAAHFYYPQAAIRDARYKLIVNPLRRPNPPAQIYTDNSGAFFIAGTRKDEVAAAGPLIQKAYATYHNPPPVELYDLQADPNEFNNLANDPKHAATQKRLQSRLREWQRDTGDLMADPAALARYTKENDEAAALKPALSYRRDKNFRWRYLDWLNADPSDNNSNK